MRVVFCQRVGLCHTKVPDTIYNNTKQSRSTHPLTCSFNHLINNSFKQSHTITHVHSIKHTKTQADTLKHISRTHPPIHSYLTKFNPFPGPCPRDSSNPNEQCCGLAVYNVRTSYCCNGRVCGTPCGPKPIWRPALRDRRIYTFAFGAVGRPMDFM